MTLDPVTAWRTSSAGCSELSMTTAGADGSVTLTLPPTRLSVVPAADAPWARRWVPPAYCGAGYLLATADRCRGRLEVVCETLPSPVPGNGGGLDRRLGARHLRWRNRTGRRLCGLLDWRSALFGEASLCAAGGYGGDTEEEGRSRRRMVSARGRSWTRGGRASQTLATADGPWRRTTSSKGGLGACAFCAR